MIACMQSGGLKHKRILLTRSARHLPALADAVRARGGIPVDFPCLQVEVLLEGLADARLQASGAYSDVVFTSSNGVHAVASQIDMATLCDGKRIAAVGKKTATALRVYGVQTDIVPEVASQDGLIAAYEHHGLPRSLLFFRAEQGRDRIVEALEKKSVPVSMVKAYRTVCPQADASEVISSLANHEIDAVLLGSAKTARFYLQRTSAIGLDTQPVVAVISESLAMAVRGMGLNVQVVAKQASFEAMLNALAEYFNASRPDDRSI